MNKLVLSVAFVIFGLAAAASSYASYGSEACQPIYGGGQTCVTTSKFILDKKVLHPEKTKGNAENFVDNLSIDDPKYLPSQNVKFQLVVTNTGNTTLSKLVLTDTIPSYVDFVSGPGKYDAKSKSITFDVLNLNTNESRKYNIVVKVKASNDLPQGQGVVCLINQASVKLNQDESKDNSQFCVEKPVTKGGLPVMPAPKITQTPSTGPEMLPLIGLIPAGIAGLLLRKRASR